MIMTFCTRHTDDIRDTPKILRLRVMINSRWEWVNL